VAVFILGYLSVRTKISDPEQKRTKELEFLVDTSASYMVIPPRIAEELGLKWVNKTRVTLADKREVEAGYAFAYVSLLGREAPVTALVFDSPMPVLGTFTLQVLGLEADPTKHEIRPSRPFALGLMHVRPGKEVSSTS
jgi:clan AA aspartic protease